MAKERKSQPETKAKANPLGAIGRRPGSYVGDLDSLLAEVGDAAPPSPSGSDPSVSKTQETEEVAAERTAKREEHPAERSKPRMKRINLDVPSDLHQQFKGVTGMAGRTMTDVLQELIREYLERTRG
ncbi:MAG: hypothetical protein ABJF88_15335 [Rhodothermales bacterium]